MKRSSKLLTFLRRLPPYLVLALVVAAAGPYCAAQADKAGAPAPGGTARPEADKADATPPSMSMLELFERGGWFMLPIVLASLVGLALIIERLISLRKDKIIPPRLLDQLKDTYKPGQEDRSAGLNYCHANASPLARVLAAGIGKMHRDEQTVEQAIEDAGANEIAKLKRNLRGLFAVGSIAPLLGLLGTVSGMIKAFQVASVKGLGKATSLAQGIYEALVTTYAGLLVAIPVLVFYYYFLGKIDRIVSEMNDLSIEFVEHYMAEPAKA
ncbi:MAG: colicin uptake protein TolQ [Planctomycetes bacterium ADurb.Bin126]|nr:MAG: colicin uptake protein TolQ [Planctomycetes bacterium ADurb.Bin126]HOD82683.1 MotA/TolQ/ExbB proton channel family protein [Phycisphaerae bacterium]HQL73846.1 MotA/TolQ/ExbB proton channel family protein [Phycisphaerae bacterium]